MSFKAILYAYIIGGFTLVPLLIVSAAWFAWYTAVPVQDVQEKKRQHSTPEVPDDSQEQPSISVEVNDSPKTRKAWLTVRRTFEEPQFEGGYVNLMRSFLDARSKDPKRSRPKDMWFVVLKGKILYLYEDEGMTECEAVIQLGNHDVVVYPEGLLDGELFTRRNAICLKPKSRTNKDSEAPLPSVTKEMRIGDTEADATANVEKRAIPDPSIGAKRREKEQERRIEQEKNIITAAREEATEPSTPWFIFVRTPCEMEDWYLALVHASDNPHQTPLLDPLQPVFLPSDMNILVSKLDEQPDVIPMRWFNALLGRILLSFYRTQHLESFIIGRLMKKISKVKRPSFLPSLEVTEVSVGNTTPLFSKPMLKELTKEGDASMEVHLQYKGEFRITIEATVIISVPLSKTTYTVRVALAAILKEIEGNMLIKIKRPPSNRIWYAFTQMPKVVLDIEPIVSDRQITWGMILSTIESKIKETIQESVVLPNMDDISYFETAAYSHRGGIWADAVRKVATALMTEVISPETAATDLPKEDPDNTTEFIPVPIIKSQTVTSTSSEPAPSAPLLSSSPESMKRRTWFSSISSAKEMDIDAANNSVDEPQRATSDFGEATLPPRPWETEDVQELNNGDQSDGNTSNDVDSGPPHSSHRRTPSGRSTTSDVPPASNIPQTSNIPPASNESSSTAVPLSRTPTLPNTPSSPSNFLAALKTKTADKQALTNSAKEAMKKWGMNVNWGNLRKDTTSPASSARGHSEELADQDTPGSGLARTRTTSSTNSSIAQKARASYAEVRAAVAERRGRQQASSGSQLDDTDEEHLSAAVPPRTSSRSPDPSRNTAESEVSLNLSAPSPRKLSSASSSHSSRGYLDPNEVEREAPRPPPQAVSMSRVPTQNSQGSYGGVGKGSPPVYSVQPQAKTMSIPGIHASHRGEVMSMGYVPSPQPQPVPLQESGSSQERKSKVLSSLGGTAGIQSVYRLFSKPQGQGAQGETTSPDQEEAGQDEERTSNDSLPTPTPSVPSQAFLPGTPRKRTPPPLPPRSSPIVVPGTTSVPSSSTNGMRPPPPLPPRAILSNRSSSSEIRSMATVSASPSGSDAGLTNGSPMPSDDPPSAASEKLKSIAKRASLTGPKDKIDVESLGVAT